MSAPKQRDPMVITHVGGVQFSAQVRSHRILVDQPERGGGADGGPSPMELLGVSLGTCVALYVQQFC
ncbi:MAG: OsmC family protein, partial [Gemmatimonadaceae bacterium]